MSDDPLRPLVERYLREVADALSDLLPAQRREILDDLRTHIHDALAAVPDPDEATVRSILDRLGTPDELAREARERLGIVGSAPEPETARRPGLFETIAVVATAIVWPIGLVLVWLSESWQTRDKLVASALPLLGLALVVLWVTPIRVDSRVESYELATPVTYSPGAEPSVAPPVGTPTVLATPPSHPRTTVERANWASLLGIAILLGGSFGLPFASALYLAFQLRRPKTSALHTGGTSSFTAAGPSPRHVP
ncbi:hypothetical protein NET02_01490 [Thermomicrobiaceae bacterium CFH 74404]|uniref:DUF1700 domain-containing protein n=1 Tax=Thermalbibacter longus TaxID=2951981 RepID=A0AA41WD42_9BACT|nr:hypothetical protein [Thermalbibacter longus]MCM8747815.1 hypothetical protein [Thermalbibacter longus]